MSVMKRVACFWLILFFAVFLRLELALWLPEGVIFDEETHLQLIRGEYALGEPTLEAYLSNKPTYYFLLSPFRAAPLFDLRLFSVFLGGLLVILTYFIVREVSTVKIALFSSGLTAFMPLYVQLGALVNSDSLAIVFSFLMALMLLKNLKTFKFRFLILAEVFMVLAFITKPTAFFLAIPFIIAVSRQIYVTHEFKYLYSLIPLSFPLMFFNIGAINLLTVSNPFSLRFLFEFPVFFEAFLMDFVFPQLMHPFYSVLALPILLYFGLLFSRVFFNLRKIQLSFLEVFLFSFLVFNLVEIVFLNFYSVWSQGRYLLFSGFALNYFIVRGLFK